MEYRWLRLVFALVGLQSAVLAFRMPALGAPTGPILKVPNQVDYWKNEGFEKMEGPLRLPTDGSETDIIQVWLKLPENAKLTAQRINDSQEDRYTLIYPPGTIADRIEFEIGSGGVDDVRGSRIDVDGSPLFHVYETAPGTDQSWLEGYEWRRSDDVADVIAGEALIKLLYPHASQGVKNHFRQLNHCGACHEPNAPSPLTTASPFRFESDTQGFFQPITVLQNEMTVRDHRSRDINADDPFITVWCGNQPTKAVVSGMDRWYSCPNEQAPVGKLDIVAALAAKDAHALQICESRAYLFRHMDDNAQAAFAPAFEECKIH